VSHLGVYIDLQNNPLGTQANENFSVPSNYRIPDARVYVINHSRTRAWKSVKVAVSHIRGGDAALAQDRKLREMYNEDMIYKRVAEGRDMNVYETGIKPVIWKLALPGGKFLPIPPAPEDRPDVPFRVEVPDGTWDLYLGNFDRMQGYPGLAPRDRERQDPAIVSEERSRLSLRWQRRHNPVFAWRIDEEPATDLNNPFGVLEFVRVTQRAMADVVDKDFLTALDLVEA
jgi:hypothetical protein